MKINVQNSDLALTAALPSQFPSSNVPQIAFSGRSNVGKSSLINCLLRRKKLARVSSTPGKTVTVNFYSVDGKMYLVDLPGYGFAKRTAEEKKKWSELTDSFFTSRDGNASSLKAVVQLIDMKVGPTPDDLMMLDYLNSVGTPYFIVASKSDKVNKTDRSAALKSLSTNPKVKPGTPIVPFSSLSNEGRDEIWTKIISFL